MNASGLSFKMGSSPSKPRSYHLKWLVLVFSRDSQSRARHFTSYVRYYQATAIIFVQGNFFPFKNEIRVY